MREPINGGGRVTAAPWRVLAVSSSGGVLLDLLALRPWLDNHDVTWACVPAEDTRSALAEEKVRWLPECDGASLGNLLATTRGAFQLLSAIDPQLVISAGTGVAVPIFLAARVKGIPSVWVETFNVIGRPGRAARICARLAALTLVQHASLLPTRRRSALVGELF